MSVQRRFLVIINPHAGRGAAAKAWAAAEPILRAADCTWRLAETSRPDHARELLTALSPEECDAVVVVGGDGTLHEAINGLMAATTTKPPLGLIPAGTGNSLATDLGCLDPIQAARAIAEGRRRPLDVMAVRFRAADDRGAGAGALGESHARYAFNIVGWGLAAEAGARAAWLGQRAPWLRVHRYTMANLLELMRRRAWPVRLRLRTGEGTEEELEGDFVMALACNTQHTGAGMRIAPRARLDDGLFDLIIVPKLSRARLLALMGSIPSGRHLEAPELLYRQVSGFELMRPASGGQTVHGLGRVNLDGEILPEPPASFLEVSVCPGALNLLHQ